MSRNLPRTVEPVQTDKPKSFWEFEIAASILIIVVLKLFGAI